MDELSTICNYSSSFPIDLKCFCFIFVLPAEGGTIMLIFLSEFLIEGVDVPVSKLHLVELNENSKRSFNACSKTSYLYGSRDSL